MQCNLHMKFAYGNLCVHKAQVFTASGVSANVQTRIQTGGQQMKSVVLLIEWERRTQFM